MSLCSARVEAGGLPAPLLVLASLLPRERDVLCHGSERLGNRPVTVQESRGSKDRIDL